MADSRACRFINNARVETLKERPLFRDLLRCALLADGWYEWQRVGSKKQPWYHHRDGQLFYMAGVYRFGAGCAVITQSASGALAGIHHRQPVLLDAQHLARWLDGAQSWEDLPELEVSRHPVSMRVGNARHDDSGLITPVCPDGALVGQTGDLFPEQ